MALDELLEEINLLHADLEKLRPIKDEDQRRLWKKIRLEFNYNSNHLEGNTLTYGQTELLLFYDKVAENSILSDLEQMKSHDVALSKIVEVAEDPTYPLTEQFIKELNRLVLVRPFWKEAITADGLPTRKEIQIGEYKSSPNSVRLPNGEIHEYASVQDTPIKMAELIQWYRENEDTLHPAQLAAQFHYRFVVIHPFDDGNGRVARLVMNYILLKHGYPLIIVKSADKENYLTALQRADVGEKEAIDLYLLKELKHSLNLYIKAAKGEDLTEADDLDKEIALLKKEKLSQPRAFFTPKVNFEISKDIKENFWPSIMIVLKKFGDFFQESRELLLINKIEYNPDMSKRITDSMESIYPGGKKLYGINLDQEPITCLEMIYHIYALKSASEKRSFQVSLKVEFGTDSTYQLFLAINQNELFNATREYSSGVLESDIQTFTQEISGFFLKVIKEIS